MLPNPVFRCLPGRRLPDLPSGPITATRTPDLPDRGVHVDAPRRGAPAPLSPDLLPLSWRRRRSTAWRCCCSLPVLQLSAYLHDLGKFHLVVGMLQLFGFNLPQTNHFYFLARASPTTGGASTSTGRTSCSEDLLLPVLLPRCRRMARRARWSSPRVAFLPPGSCTPTSGSGCAAASRSIWQDMVFWGAMGVVVLGTMIRGTRHGRKRTPGQAQDGCGGDSRGRHADPRHPLAICTFWAVWSVGSFARVDADGRWLVRPGPADGAWIAGALVGIGLVRDRVPSHRPGRQSEEWSRAQDGVRVLVSAFRVGMVSGCSSSPFTRGFCSTTRRGWRAPDRLRNPLRLSRPAPASIGATTRTSPTSPVSSPSSPSCTGQAAGMGPLLRDPPHRRIPFARFVPWRDMAFKGARMTTNRGGMRDRE